MSDIDPEDLERIDREIRINEIKHRVAELTGGEMTSYEAEDAPPPILEAFWESVLQYEQAPVSSDFTQLEEAGVYLPAPEELSDEELTAKLWEMIEQLARKRTFVERTNHLSDRELYSNLWSESLREMHPCMPYNESGAWNIDILGGCSEEDLHLSLKYYDDEEARQRWKASFPEYIIPPHEDPPYDRDRLLPKPEYK
jgi:hypothetical protein